MAETNHERKIGWSAFYKLLEPKFETGKCRIRTAIYDELNLLADKDNHDWDQLLELAKVSVPVNWSSGGASLKNSFRRGAGSKKVAAAIHYWFHTTEGLSSYATEIDLKAFKKPFEDVFPHLSFPTKSEFGERTVKLEMNSPALIVTPEIEALREKLDNADLNDQRYSMLFQLVVRIEDIMSVRDALFPGAKQYSIFRSCFAQKESWISPDDIIVPSPNIDDWLTKFRRPPELEQFSIDKDGKKLILVIPNGTRISTDVFHRLDTWFSTLFQVLDDGIIEARDVDVFLRYILIFISHGRAAFLRFYFNDEAGKLDRVFRVAIDRAAHLRLNLRDYGPFEEEYLQYYHLRTR